MQRRRELIESWTARRALTATEVTTQLRALGVEQGGVLLVHTSYRAVRPVEGGPVGLIDALRTAIGPNGTLVLPSSTGNDDEPFDPAATPADSSLGVVADTFWQLSDVLRSDHPFAFAAQGPMAKKITSDAVPFPPHKPESPVGRVYELDGQGLLIGVGHDSSTTLHLAELLAGVPYRRSKYCTLLQDGRPKRVDYEENDHCCQRFALADEWLRFRGLQSEGPVGYAHARLMRSRDIVATACEHLAKNPLLFLHPKGTGCRECEDAWRSVNG